LIGRPFKNHPKVLEIPSFDDRSSAGYPDHFELPTELAGFTKDHWESAGVPPGSISLAKMETMDHPSLGIKVESTPKPLHPLFALML
jgi:hypothetical protein